MNHPKADPAMQCQECVAMLTDYLEGVLSAADRARFENHLRLCPNCDTYHTKFRRAVDLARAAGHSEPAQPAPAPSTLIQSILKARKGSA